MGSQQFKKGVYYAKFSTAKQIKDKTDDF